MIFTRKYVFESKKTKYWRYVLNIASFIGIFCFCYITFLFYLPFFAKLEKKTTEGALFLKTPDAIVVFTGDKGRIKYTIDLHKKWPEALLLISGVHGSNSLKTLIPEESHLLNSSAQVEIDYEAKNTLDNVRETLNYLKNSEKKLERVLIISSDYHIFRIKMILDRSDKDKNISFYYDSVFTDWKNFSQWRKIFKESFKIFRTWFILKFN
jgi:uncharacterized SAM-binding protein YcdF (DUF218 family)